MFWLGQRYPYFIQLWGEALWERWRTTRTARLDADDVAQVRPMVVSRSANYYQTRYRELEASVAPPIEVVTRQRFCRTPSPW